ncbi:MAG: efflux transporter outer membrane subunit [Prevotella sp.]|nr:efflux transporter outer membrane subunit [Prevotella sp.]
MITRSKINILILGLAAVTLTGCKSLYGKYERPEVNMQGIVRDPLSLTDTLAVSDTTSFGKMPWREVFTDPQLQSLIQQALDNNPDLLNAALNVKMVETQLTVAKLAFLPQITFTPQGTIASWDGNKPTKTYQLPIAASWNIDLFGRILSQKRSAQMQLLATKDYQTVVKTNIISGVANMYYTLMMIDAQMEVINGMEDLTEKTWNLMKEFKGSRQGYTEAAVTSAEANYLSVKAQKVDLLRQMREVENSLSLVLGQPAQTIGRGRLENQSLPTNLSAGISLQLLNNRADVHAAEMQLAQCFYGVETARSRFYPSITITPNGTFTNSAGSMIVNPGKWMLSVVGSLVQPIFMNGQIVAGLKVAKMQYEQAYNTWQQAVLKAGSEVSNALVQYNSSMEKADLEARQIKALETNLNTATTLFNQRGGTYLEMIQAQSTLLNAQISKITDDFNKMQAVVSLYQALGGGAE